MRMLELASLRDAGAPQNISVDELKQLPYPKLTRLWKEYVDEMRAALDEAAGDETSVAGKRVVSLIEELRMVLTCLMSAIPLGMQSLRCDSISGSVPLCLSAAPAMSTGSAGMHEYY